MSILLLLSKFLSLAFNVLIMKRLGEDLFKFILLGVS